MARKILLVDDEPLILKGLKYSLEQDGYLTDSAMDGEEALAKFFAGEYDLILLDVMLPGLDGIEVCQRIRERSNVPIIMLTAKGEDMDKILGLEYGADDYMTKPFSMRELIARCKALLRRVERAKVIAKNSENEKILNFGSLVIDPAQRLVTVNGEQVHLTPTEFDLLVTLARKPKSVLTREKLLEEVWDWVDASGTRTVDSHVKALRHKLGSETIRTVHGVGYAFEPPEQ